MGDSTAVLVLLWMAMLTASYCLKGWREGERFTPICGFGAVFLFAVEGVGLWLKIVAGLLQ